jgi:GNAT superfamily N-acetyltransferase
MDIHGGKSTQHIVIIRKAVPAEVDKIAELNRYLFDLSKQNFDPSLRQSWQDTDEVNKYFRDVFDDPNALFIVAVDEDKLVGYLSGRIRNMDSYREMVPSAELENMMVLPEYQRKGIGGKLLDTFLSWCKVNGIRNVAASVYAKNTSGLDFYKHKGFESYDMTLEITLPPATPEEIAAATAPIPGMPRAQQSVGGTPVAPVPRAETTSATSSPDQNNPS